MRSFTFPTVPSSTPPNFISDRMLIAVAQMVMCGWFGSSFITGAFISTDGTLTVTDALAE